MQESPIISEIKAALIALPVIGLAIWGALGGATNALVIRVTLWEALRHVALGGLFAAGVGGLGAPLLGFWLGLPPDALTASGGAAGGSLAYLTGSLGSAAFEVVLQRIRAGRLPRDTP